MAKHEMSEWKCMNGHVMGMVMRNGSGIRILLLYRQAIDARLPEGQENEVEVIGALEGYMANIKCSLCGAIRTWQPGEESIRRLIEKHLKNGGKGV